ncbi:DUF1972 domain-containing protein [Alloscardovia criceti]|uniref:DUF1972 domain-containing protein n=1 Tax=Alloscardovia criceti TaxID=356828 RepID=UPI0003737D32|nr:DUF1972 domain-containing protein [Alloscardovia criceti]
MNQHVFIIGNHESVNTTQAPARYSGLVENLVKNRANTAISYHIACLTTDESHTHFSNFGADYFTVAVSRWMPLRQLVGDISSLRYALEMVKEQAIASPIFLLISDALGILTAYFAQKIHEVGGRLIVKPRVSMAQPSSSWMSRVAGSVRQHIEKQKITHADIALTDNPSVRDYLRQKYPKVSSAYIPLGTAPIQVKMEENNSIRQFFAAHGIEDYSYYLLVVHPHIHDNFAMILHEFMQSKTSHKLVVLADRAQLAEFKNLREKTSYQTDERIIFADMAENETVLGYLRQKAFASIIDGHAVEPNAELLQSLSSTDLNLVLRTDANQSMAQDACLYWDLPTIDTTGVESDTEQPHDAAHPHATALHTVINKADELSHIERQTYGAQAQYIVDREFVWSKIVPQYEALYQEIFTHHD